MNEETALLRALLMTAGRAAFPVKDLYELVNPAGRAAKQVQAFNLADATRTQADLAKKTKIDRGNFSKTVSRWIGAGIMFRIGDDGKLLHIYPVPLKLPKSERTCQEKPAHSSIRSTRSSTG